MGEKKGLYEVMGVREYILFDPRSEYLKPRFKVFRLEGDYYVPYLTPEEVGYSSSLGLTFRVVDGSLRIFRTPTNIVLPTPAELNARLQTEERRADEEQRRADGLAERLRELGVDPESFSD